MAAAAEPRLRATLCEIERGLFYIAYSPCQKDRHDLPAFHLGPCAAVVKQNIEKAAKARGYEAIVWEDALNLPPDLVTESTHLNQKSYPGQIQEAIRKEGASSIRTAHPVVSLGKGAQLTRAQISGL